MTVAASRNVAITPKPIRVPGLLARLVRNVRALLKSSRSHEPQPVQGYKEILPYGFVSRNYLAYMSKAVSPDQVKYLGDGTRVCYFQNGGVLLATMCGYVVELDKQGRVILVRVRIADVEESAIDCCPSEDSSMLGVTSDTGSTTMELPGGISVNNSGSEVRITLPNGVTYTQAIAA